MRVAINGFGRIGKLVFRAFLEKNLKGVDIVAINELGSLESSLHLMQYDSIHGKLPVQIIKTKWCDCRIWVNGKNGTKITLL